MWNPSDAISPGLWYSLEPMWGLVKAEACHPKDADDGFNFQLTVLQGDCDNQTCVDGTIAVDDHSHPVECTSVQWFSLPDEQYTVFIHGFRLQMGKFELEITLLSSLGP